ncbi:MAG TPA: pyridoxamine 5'-phosphate oxidase family protein [Mycobacteriales bacterium]|jgi:nitroimidazol reductase NimA-like FMN-containing flavoprotein (pyridoxamine 5'-phosphate oxidase superfamily)|nr:pyridoxamine 5'-phosphate oxidase family protein [Mycobacteriales bacterium]
MKALDDAARSELAAMARSIVDANRYLTLSSADASGLPWISPVYFAPAGHRRYLWASSPGSRHSRNIAARPEVAIVVYDSTVAVGRGQAVYAAATAGPVPDDELEDAARVYSARLAAEAYEFGVDDLRAPASLRLYEARVVQHSVLIRGGDPEYGSELDRREPVDLGR